MVQLLLQWQQRAERTLGLSRGVLSGHGHVVISIWRLEQQVCLLELLVCHNSCALRGARNPCCSGPQCLLKGLVRVRHLQALSLLSEFQQTVHRPRSQNTGAALKKRQQVGRMFSMQGDLWQPRQLRAC